MTWQTFYNYSFRPQQGLPIMNKRIEIIRVSIIKEFPSPTGVTYYELLIQKRLGWYVYKIKVSVPNRGYLLWIMCGTDELVDIVYNG